MNVKDSWLYMLNRPWLSGNPLLHVAVMACQANLYDLLVRLGANPHTPDSQGMTVFHTAVLHRHFEDAQPFFDRAMRAGVDINAREKDGYSALHFAVFHNYLRSVAWFLDHGANLRARTAIGTTALRHAVRWRRVSATRKLLEAGAYVDERDHDGETPLLEATVSLELAMLLTDFGADIHACNHDGENLLHLAGARANPEMVRWALDHGVKQDATNALGHTPLQAVQSEIKSLYGGVGALRKAFAEAPETSRPLLDGSTAGNLSLVLSMLGHPHFSDVAQA